MSRQLTKLTSIYFALLILVLVGGCSDDDCPTCPKDEAVKPYKGFLYYVEANPLLYEVYVVDMEADSIVDSIRAPYVEAGSIDVSLDGRYLALRSSDWDPSLAVTTLYDAQSRSVIGELPGAITPYFDLERDLLIGFRADSLNTYMQVYRWSDRSLLSEDTTGGFWHGVIERKNHYVYGRGDSNLRFRFYRFDYINRSLELIPITHTLGDTVQVLKFCLDPAGKRVYFRGLSVPAAFEDFAFTGAYDLESRTLLWSYVTMGQYGGIALSPDGREVYMTDPGISGFSGFDPGAFFVLDAQTGALIEAISTYGYRDNPLRTLATSDVVFSPTGEKAYVASGGIGDRPAASVLVVDTKTRNITKILSPDLQRVPRNMKIGPKL